MVWSYVFDPTDILGIVLGVQSKSERQGTCGISCTRGRRTVESHVKFWDFE
jgi:hypothetical protein